MPVSLRSFGESVGLVTCSLRIYTQQEPGVQMPKPSIQTDNGRLLEFGFHTKRNPLAQVHEKNQTAVTIKICAYLNDQLARKTL